MQNEIIQVTRQNNTPSTIVIGDVLNNFQEYLPKCRIVIITDTNVHRHYQKLIDAYDHILIGLGETNKTLATVDQIYRQLIELNVDRECFILGFGGGIVTDIAGFVASTYMRGLRFGFIASTLLAQVDASVGGKNGVNVEGYKNMVGVFNQPDFVLCPTSLLKTLPEREFRAGLAEVIKAGIIEDSSLFELIEQPSLQELRTDETLLTQLITRSIRVKARIVEADEREAGERRKLNLGHTVAHAIEKSTQEFLHGEAVAIGLVSIAEIARQLGKLDPQSATRIRNVIEQMGLPVSTKVERRRLAKAIHQDKKSAGDEIYIVLPRGIGDVEVQKMAFDEFSKLLTEG